MRVALEDGQGRTQHRRGLIEAIGGQQCAAEVAERLSHLGMIATEDPPLDDDRTPLKRDRLGVLAAPLQNGGEPVERVGNLVVVAPEDALQHRQYIAQRQLRLAPPAVRVQDRGQRDAIGCHR